MFERCKLDMKRAEKETDIDCDYNCAEKKGKLHASKQLQSSDFEPKSGYGSLIPNLPLPPKPSST